MVELFSTKSKDGAVKQFLDLALSTSRRHHYLSQCYLKGFAADRDNPELFVVDAKEKRSFTTSPLNVANERDFHRIEISGLSPDALEQAFSGFEGELGPALQRIIDARSIQNENDRTVLLNFVGLIAFKNPRLRENIRKAHEQELKIFMELITSTREKYDTHVKQARPEEFNEETAEADYQRMKEFVNNGQYRIDLRTETHLQIELQNFQKLLPLIFKRHWVLYKAPRNATGFITSDHPACLMWADPAMRGGFYPPGFGLPKTQLLFPISNELAMIGAFELENDEVDANELLIAQINGAVIAHGNRQIFARSNDFSYIMQHNSSIMCGADLLVDQAKKPV